eukprot:TRINITY_DN10186_c0_g3_i2.p1 TRINITY_DN10186_c0_g3~~TRINITY_DN10186_c0_g3_i2.p1  ORF type:complete len:192 (-),score=38.73 TRINITY_DN10186_c0_g3_i2:322-897(-)
MWRRVSAQLQTLAPSWRSSLNLLRSNGRSSIRNPSFLASSSSSSSLFSTSVSGNQNPNPQSPSLSSFRLNCWWFLWWADSSIGKKRVENIMLIATGHEREELEAEIEGRKRFDMDAPVGAFGTKETPAIVRSHYDKRIVGCPGGDGEDEHDVVWFWLEKDKPHECSVCSQCFKLEVIGEGGPPDGHVDEHH